MLQWCRLIKNGSSFVHVYSLKQDLFPSETSSLFYIFCDDWQKLGKNEPTIFTKKCIKACITTKAPSLVTRPDDGSQADNRVPVYWAQRVIGTDLPSWTFLKITKRLEETSCFLTIMIHIRQVDLIAEEDHPFSKLHRSQHDSIWCSSVLAVMVKCLKE